MDSLGIVDYSRQEQMDNILNLGNRLSLTNQKDIYIIGCGGIGFWLGLYLAMMGFRRFKLFDGDNVDASNLNRIPLNQRWCGKKKVRALKAAIRSLRPDTAIATYPRHFDLDIDGENLRGYNAKIVFDCTDNAKFQQTLFNFINTNDRNQLSIKYIKLGYEGFNLGLYRKIIR